MRTDLCLMLALAARANAFFRGAPGRMEVLPGHPAFDRVHDVAFVRQIGLGGDLVADGSVPWLRRLRKEDVERVRPFLAGMASDKAEDSPWGLLTEGDRGLELWSPTLVRRFQGHDDPRPYRLAVTSGRFSRWSVHATETTSEASAGLHQALVRAKAHLEAGGPIATAGVLGKLLSLHEMECPDAVGDLGSIVPDLLPCAVPLFASATRLLGLLERTGWGSSPDPATRALAESLWVPIRVALETAV